MLKYIWQISKFDFIRNGASRDKILFHIFDSFFHVELPHAQLYYDFSPILYNAW